VAAHRVGDRDAIAIEIPDRLGGERLAVGAIAVLIELRRVDREVERLPGRLLPIGRRRRARAARALAAAVRGRQRRVACSSVSFDFFM
jgi:hypothetical protein